MQSSRNIRRRFILQKAADYPDKANSYAYRIGKARYKDQDEEQAKRLEAQYAGKEKKIDFVRVSRVCGA